MDGRDLLLGDALVGTVPTVDNDEAVGGYLRDGGRAATLNPNARSRCDGCAFRPNTLEAAADPRLLLRLTLECFSRRDLLLKASKASLDNRRMPDVLRRAQEHGFGTSFTYIVGLDPLDEMRRGVADLMRYVSEFPGFQIYQAHNRIMSHLRVPGADELNFYLEARRGLEEAMFGTGLRPEAWQCYRSLWYYTFADEELLPRV